MEVERLLSLKANKKRVKDKLEQMSAKIVTLKDISNISTKQGHKNTRNDLTETVRKLTERYGMLRMFSLDGMLMVFVKYIIYLHLFIHLYNITLSYLLCEFYTSMFLFAGACVDVKVDNDNVLQGIFFP